MTLVRIAHPHFDTAAENLDLTAALLRACRGYFRESSTTMDLATAAVDELETRAARPGHPSAGLARRWRTGTLFALARELRDGLAGVRLMVESAATATGNAASALGCCEAAPDEETMHERATALTRRTVTAHCRFGELAGHLADLDTIFKGLRAEPWSVPDRRIVELLRRKVASGDLARARRELATSESLLLEVLADVVRK
jgi:hypothetical protein